MSEEQKNVEQIPEQLTEEQQQQQEEPQIVIDDDISLMADEDLRQMIFEKQDLIITREKQLRDMSIMLNDCSDNYQKVSQLNGVYEQQLQEALKKFEHRQQAMKELLKMKEEIFIKVQKLQKEVDELS